jgi:hemerythrin-like metal-binding protein
MPVFEWNEDSLQWVKTADQQSRHLIGLLDGAYEVTARGDTVENWGELIDELIEYATARFLFEEYIMSIRYHAMDVMEHQAFIGRIAELKEAFHSGNERIPLKELTFLINWLTHNKLNIDPDHEFLSVSD